MALFIALSPLACAGQPPPSAEVRSIYEKAEFTLVGEGTLTRTEQAMGSLQVVIGQGADRFTAPSCSAFRISRDHVLTANHCVRPSLIFNPFFRAKDPKTGTLSIQTYEHNVRLSYDGEIAAASDALASAAPVLGEPVFRDEAHDFAIYRLDDPAVQGPSVDLRAATEPTAAATLLGYPNGTPLTRAACHSVAPGVPPWTAHDCDALQGSSGGLLASGDTPMALHLAGPGMNDGFYYKDHGTFETPTIFATRRGCPTETGGAAAAGCVAGSGFNRALPLSTVRDILKEQAPDLWRTLATQQLSPAP